MTGQVTATQIAEQLATNARDWLDTEQRALEPLIAHIAEIDRELRSVADELEETVEMTSFDEWLKQALFPAMVMTREEWMRAAFDAATKIEREACANIAYAKAIRCEEKTADAEDEDERINLRSVAWQFSVLAEEIRKQ